MTPIEKRKMLKKKMNSLHKRQRLMKEMEKKRRRRVCVMRLHNRLRMNLFGRKAMRKQSREERKKKTMARRETAKLNRTLKRRRKRWNCF